jgi:hypothetical protein
MLLAAGIYEALLLGGDADDCIFFVCRSLLVHPECEIGNHLIVRSRSNFPGGVCPTGISGNAISLRVPGFPTACFAVTANPDEQACAPM